MRARAYSGDLLATTLLRVNTATTSQTALHRPLLDLSEGLEAPVQLLYLLTLLGFLVVGAWLVVRQVLVRRELEEAAKVLGERTRGVDATSEVKPPHCSQHMLCVLRNCMGFLHTITSKQKYLYVLVASYKLSHIDTGKMLPSV